MTRIVSQQSTVQSTPSGADLVGAASASASQPSKRPSLNGDTVDNVLAALPAAPPPYTLKDFIAATPDSVGIGVAINGLGIPVLKALLGIPFSPAVTGIYLGIGTLVGNLYFPGKAKVQALLSPQAGGPKVSMGPAQTNELGRFTGATLLLSARPEELAGKASPSRAYFTGKSGALDEMLTQRLSLTDFERLGLASKEKLASVAEATGVGFKTLTALVDGVRSTSVAEQRVALVSKLMARTQVRGLRAVLALTEAPKALNAQAELEAHLAGLYGPRLAVAVSDAVAAKGVKAGVTHPTMSTVTVSPAVVAELQAMIAEPTSGVRLDAEGRPVLTDRAKAPAVLVRLASALPAAANRDAALLVDGSNGDRIYFGERQDHSVDAVSAAILLAGAGRASHSDPSTPDFLHSRSIVWSLQKDALSLASAQWGELVEVHHLAPEAADFELGAVFENPKYRLFGPGSADDTSIPGILELRKKAEALGRGERLAQPSRGASSSSAPAINWPSRGSLLLDQAILRATEAFVRNLGSKGHVDEEGRIFIGGPKSGLTEEQSLAICADLSLVLSAISRTDKGLDAGGPFGSVLWSPSTGEATVGKNQVVPSRAPVNHGERVGLFLHEKDDAPYVVTSGEPCAMCAHACKDNKMVFVVDTPGVEANTPFKEGKKDYSRASNAVYGPKTITNADGKVAVQGMEYLAARAPIGEQILAAWTRNGKDYSV